MNHVVPWLISGSCTERHQCVPPCDEKKTVGGSTKGQRLTGSVRLNNVEGQKENVWARKNLGIAQRLKCVGCWGCEPTMLSISFGYFYFIHNAMECIFYLFKILDN